MRAGPPSSPPSPGAPPGSEQAGPATSLAQLLRLLRSSEGTWAWLSRGACAVQLNTGVALLQDGEVVWSLGRLGDEEVLPPGARWPASEHLPATVQQLPLLSSLRPRCAALTGSSVVWTAGVECDDAPGAVRLTLRQRGARTALQDEGSSSSSAAALVDQMAAAALQPCEEEGAPALQGQQHGAGAAGGGPALSFTRAVPASFFSLPAQHRVGKLQLLDSACLGLVFVEAARGAWLSPFKPALVVGGGEAGAQLAAEVNQLLDLASGGDEMKLDAATLTLGLVLGKAQHDTYVDLLPGAEATKSALVPAARAFLALALAHFPDGELVRCLVTSWLAKAPFVVRTGGAIRRLVSALALPAGPRTGTAEPVAVQDQDTPLHLAARDLNMAAVQGLLELKADGEARNKVSVLVSGRRRFPLMR